MGAGVGYFEIKFGLGLGIGLVLGVGRVSVSFYGSFRVIRDGVRVSFWLGPSTQLRFIV